MSYAVGFGATRHHKICTPLLTEIHLVIAEDISGGGVLEVAGAFVIVGRSTLADYGAVERHSRNIARAELILRHHKRQLVGKRLKRCCRVSRRTGVVTEHDRIGVRTDKRHFLLRADGQQVVLVLQERHRLLCSTECHGSMLRCLQCRHAAVPRALALFKLT